MDPGLLFWTGAFGLLLLIVTFVLLGFLRIRQGLLAEHRRWMYRAGALTLLFLAAYALKIGILGKEDLSTWKPDSLIILWCHETVVAVMLLSGTAARILARYPHLRSTWHRLCGRICVTTAMLALGTAGLVLWEMYRQ